MKRRSIIAVLFIALFTLSLAPALFARDVDPIVSTDWLEKNLSNPKVVVVDVRKVEDYKAGHIPGAVNVFYGSWAVGKGGIRNELPPTDDLSDTIASAGIGMDSIVVLVGKADGIPERTEPTRVAWTLKYAGLENIAILDGGYNKWVADKKAVSTDAVKPKAAKEFKGKTRNELFANKDYIMSRLGRALIVDVREVPFYKGEKKLEFVPKMGRIKGAVNLPTSSVYAKDGVFNSKADLAAAAVAVVGSDKSKEIIVYCDTGKVCTAWAYILADLFGYTNVKDYDGSTEEWMKDRKAPVEP